MPENPQTPSPYQPVKPWISDMVKDKTVAKPVVEEAPKLGVPPVVEEVKPVVENKPAVPVVEKPVVTPVVTETPAVATAPTAPVSNVPPASPLK